MMAPLQMRHAVLDGEAEAELSQGTVAGFLADLVAALEMTLVSGPHLWQAPLGSWCGLAIIAESHVSLHCQGREVHADCFACFLFEPEVFRRLCLDRLRLKHTQMRVLDRGDSRGCP